MSYIWYKIFICIFLWNIDQVLGFKSWSQYCIQVYSIYVRNGVLAVTIIMFIKAQKTWWQLSSIWTIWESTVYVAHFIFLCDGGCIKPTRKNPVVRVVGLLDIFFSVSGRSFLALNFSIPCWKLYLHHNLICHQPQVYPGLYFGFLGQVVLASVMLWSFNHTLHLLIH